MYIPLWALLILLIACIWAIATRASRSYAEAIDVALGEAKRDFGDKIDSLKDDVRDLRSEVDQLRTDTECTHDNLRTDVDSQEKDINSLRADLDYLRDERNSE